MHRRMKYNLHRDPGLRCRKKIYNKTKTKKQKKQTHKRTRHFRKKTKDVQAIVRVGRFSRCPQCPRCSFSLEARGAGKDMDHGAVVGMDHGAVVGRERGAVVPQGQPTTTLTLPSSTKEHPIKVSYWRTSMKHPISVLASPYSIISKRPLP